MNVISQLTQEQENQIPTFVEKWTAISMSTEPIEWNKFEIGTRDLHAEIKIQVPEEFLYFSSPTAMWRDFENWKSKITSVQTQYWSYQIPLCDPESMHRLWSPGNTRPAFNFAAQRYSPGMGYALCETPTSNESWGTVISRELHAQLWAQFEFNNSLLDWGRLGSDSFEEDGVIHKYLWKRFHEDEPTSQMCPDECCFLSPEYWLLKELACVDFCANVLGVERNKKLYGGLEAIVQYGSFCGTFGRLCVACERPKKIEIRKDGFDLIYRDGEIFSFSYLW